MGLSLFQPLCCWWLKFGQYKMMQKNFKMTETLANGYSYESAQRELSNQYQHDRVQMVFKICYVIAYYTKVVSALKGLKLAPSKEAYTNKA